MYYFSLPKFIESINSSVPDEANKDIFEGESSQSMFNPPKSSSGNYVGFRAFGSFRLCSINQTSLISAACIRALAGLYRCFSNLTLHSMLNYGWQVTATRKRLHFGFPLEQANSQLGKEASFRGGTFSFFFLFFILFETSFVFSLSFFF